MNTGPSSTTTLLPVNALFVPLATSDLLSAPTGEHIKFGPAVTFYDLSNPTLLYRVNAAGTAFTLAQSKSSMTLQQYATFIASNTPPSGYEVLISDAGPAGVVLRYVGGSFRPITPQSAFVDFTSYTGLAQTAQQAVKSYSIPQGLLAGQRFRIKLASAKAGTTDAWSTLEIRVNSSAGVVAGGSIVNYGTFMAASPDLSRGDAWEFVATDATHIQKLGSGGAINSFVGTVSAGAPHASVVVASLASATFINVLATMSGTTNAPSVGDFEIELLPY